jgi:CheY-like chemotaxis protein
MSHEWRSPLNAILGFAQLMKSCSPLPTPSISANAMPHDIKRGLGAGFFRYLTKPINVNEFMASLECGAGFCGAEVKRRKSQGSL